MKTLPRRWIPIIAIAAIGMMTPHDTHAEGDPERGRKAFLACVSCHSAEPGVHKSGPSLANIWSKTAGSIEIFGRYSAAIKASDITWNEDTLDAWLRDPQSLIPGTLMRIRSIDSSRDRQDIIAYLKKLASSGAAPPEGAQLIDPAELSNPPTEIQVTAIKLCRDTYEIETADGQTVKYWEFNLRLKTDSSAKGPPEGVPVLVGSGMRGDRASLVFASPAEISPFIEKKC
ncbi:MAG: c-type cytochrome [Rhodospirillales bacterium]